MTPSERPGGSREPDEPLPEDGIRRDLRTGRHEDLGVEISRDLTARGRLARGSSTNMSRLSFHMGPVPREDPEPDLQALPDPPPPVTADAGAPGPSPVDVPPAATARRSVVARIFSSLFGRGSSA